MRETFYKGAQGNLSLHLMTVELAALAAAGKVTLTDHLPLGTQITGIRHVTEALGASTALTIDVVDKAAASVELLAVTTTSALEGTKALLPIYIGDNGPSSLVLENTGASAATGKVHIALEYRFKGY